MNTVAIVCPAFAKILTERGITTGYVVWAEIPETTGVLAGMDFTELVKPKQPPKSVRPEHGWYRQFEKKPKRLFREAIR